MYDDHKRLPLAKAALIIFFVTLLISGTGTLSWLYYRHISANRSQDSHFTIAGIIASHKGEALPLGYLSEILQLAKDKPINLYAYSLSNSEKQLLSHPLIRKANIKKVYPDKIWVDYQLRKPIALVADFSNTAIDSEGVLFPYAPFYHTKNLPQIYLGVAREGRISKNDSIVWGNRIESPEFQLACEILATDFPCEVVDVADAYAESCGKRQVIVTGKENGQTIILRLPLENFRERMADYASLKKVFEQESLQKSDGVKIIDLRIPQLAFIANENL